MIHIEVHILEIHGNMSIQNKIKIKLIEHLKYKKYTSMP